MARGGGERFIRRFVPRSRRKSLYQGERLSPPQGFARGPLRKTSAEDLSSRTFSQQADIEALQHFVFWFATSLSVHAQICRTNLGEKRAQRFGTHARPIDLRLHSAQQHSARRL